MNTGKIMVVSTATGRTFAFDSLTGTGYEIEVVEAIPIEALPKMEPLEKPKPKCYGRKKSNNLSRWR